MGRVVLIRRSSGGKRAYKGGRIGEAIERQGSDFLPGAPWLFVCSAGEKSKWKGKRACVLVWREWVVVGGCRSHAH